MVFITFFCFFRCLRARASVLRVRAGSVIPYILYKVFCFFICPPGFSGGAFGGVHTYILVVSVLTDRFLFC